MNKRQAKIEALEIAKKRKFKCTGCGEDRPCYLETNKESSIMDVYTEDVLVCVLDATNRTGFNWEEVEANAVTTGEKQCNLPVVMQRSELLLFADYYENDKTSQTTDEVVDNYLAEKSNSA